MKTSSSQFDLMVTFMEQHGDLSKLLSNARGKIINYNKWEEITQLLNSDGSGCTKTTEKWRKVWSDFKNNTKKKAARLHRSANATGGAPAMYTKLTNLEQRVLKITGVQAATGLAVEEARLPQVNNTHIDDVGHIIPTSQPHQYIEVPVVPSSPPSLIRAIYSPPHTHIGEEVQTSSQPEQSVSFHQSPPESRPDTTPHLSYVDVHVEGHGIISPCRPTSPSPIHVAQPAQISGQITPQHRRVRNRTSPRRRLRPAHTEQATQYFLQAEESWRQFKAQQHQDNLELRRDQNRLREMEIQTQRLWHATTVEALDMLKKLVDKYCKE